MNGSNNRLSDAFGSGNGMLELEEMFAHFERSTSGIVRVREQVGRVGNCVKDER